MAVDKVAYTSVSQNEKKEEFPELPDLPIQKLPQGWGTRHTQALLFFISLSVGYSMRAQLSVTVVAMTSNSTLQMWYPNISTTCLYPVKNITSVLNYTHGGNIKCYSEQTNTSAVDYSYRNEMNESLHINISSLAPCETNMSKVNKTFNKNNDLNLSISNSSITNDMVKVDSNHTDHVDKTMEDELCRKVEADFAGWTVYRVYKWEKPTQEMIQFSFFLGYTCMMMPMAMLTQRFGGKVTLMVALGSNGVLSFVTPWIPIFGGWIGMCLIRLVQGLTQSAFYPSIHSMLGKWAPLNERGTLGAYIYTGSQFGTVVAFQIAGLFAGSPGLGWPATFWFCGVVSLVCLALLAKLGAATPHEHPGISIEEFAYISGDSNADSKPIERRTPWKQILTSPAIWGIVAAHAGSALAYLYILTQIPIYMSKVLNVDIKNNGLLSSLPYIFMYLASISFGYLSDWFIKRKILSVVNIRRIGNSIGMVLSAIFLVAFCYVKSTLLAVVFLVLCLATHSGVHVGFHINSIDLAPNFAGPIMALGNMLANLTSLTIPVMVSNIVGNDTENQYKWQILIITIAVVEVVTNTIFVVFARGTVQSWNFTDEDIDEQQKGEEKAMEKSICLARASVISVGY